MENKSKKTPEELRELRIKNLKPWKPGVSGNPAGRTKGSKNLSTILRELEDEDFDWDKVPIKSKELAKQIGAPWKAIMFTALAKAYSGDVRAMEWLRKGAYGDKMDITSDGEQITTQPIIISEITSRQAQGEQENAETQIEATSTDTDTQQ